jgi:hypothetical protein
MLAVVQQQQDLPRPEILCQRQDFGLIGLRHEPNGRQDRARHHARIADRRQINPDHAIGERPRDLVGNRQRQARFANAAWPRQAQEWDRVLEEC